MRKIAVSAALVAAFFLNWAAPAGAAEPATVTPAVAAQIDAAMQAALKKYDYPSLSVAIAQDGKVVYTRAFGSARLPETPATPDTVYEVGSVTKQFTAAAILQLAEAGKLSVDDPLAKYYPTLPGATQITLRNLLTHTSGINNFLDRPEVRKRVLTRVSEKDVIQTFAHLPLDFEPGTQWAYSNSNYILLGAIVERVSGQSLGTYFRKHLFEPAGMTSTWYDDVAAPGSRLAEGLARKGNAWVATPLWDLTWARSAGGILSTAADIARWDVALDSGKIVSPASFAEMTTPFVLKDGKATNYGFGEVVQPFAGRQMVAHSGGISGFAALNFSIPADRIAVVVLTNTVELPGQFAVDAALGELYPQTLAAIQKDRSVPVPGEDPAITSRARSWLVMLERGQIDRAQLSAETNKALTPTVVKGAAAQIGPLGEPASFTYRGKEQANGSTVYHFRMTFARVPTPLLYQFGLDPGGKITVLLLTPTE